MREPASRAQARDASRQALDVVAHGIDIVMEGVEFGARDHVARFLGDEFGGGLGQAACRRCCACLQARAPRPWRPARR
jgi:hypothetical protein